jgi:hypothetical protein
MMDREDEVIVQLCAIPDDYYRLGNISAVELIKDSGFLKLPEGISHSKILAHLNRNPNLVDAWQQWSEDQRCNVAWALGEIGSGYYVGYLGQPYETYDDKTDACANFIVKWASETVRYSKGH